jgi:hypothetical protein
MNLPKWRPPWYAAINSKLEEHEWWINAGLLIIVAISVILILRGDRLSRAAWLVYLVSP